jgi:hypothetical protein
MRVNSWLPARDAPSKAVTLIGYRPTVPSPGVPARIAVPLPMSVKVTPKGNGPHSENDVGNDLSVVVKVNFPAIPTMNVV